jgi:hypothetical protein
VKLALALVLAAVAVALGPGCSKGDIRDFEYTEDIPSDVMEALGAQPEKQLLVADAGAMPWAYLRHGEIRREHDPEGLRARWRAAYGSGYVAQRYHDANYDAAGKNLSYRITELWFVGLGFKWDAMKWVDPDGRVRHYLDATVLFGAFGYSEFEKGHDLIFLWVPFPLP